MCGICGYWDFKGRDISKLLRQSLYAISHRGPDGVGVFVDGKLIRSSWSEFFVPKGSLGLGHAHLAIVGELQPIANEDGSLWLIHNGEIYNYTEIRSYLEKRGHSFSYKTDSEALLHAIESGSINEVIGDYASAIYDSKKEEVVLYRDFPGIRPLFYCLEDKFFSFCSEKKGIKGNCERVIEVKPGYKIVVSFDGVIEEPFFDPRTEWISKDVIKSEELAVRALLSDLVESVSLMCYKSIGISFSGGLDSSLIAKLAEEYCGEIRAYTVGFENSKDVSNAKTAAKQLDLDLEVIIIKDYDLEWLLEKTIYYVEDWDPVKISIALPLFEIFRQMKEDGLKVVFTGQGADELFGGYAKYLKSKDLANELLNDVLNLHLSNLNRDDHVSMANSIEVRYPYLNKNVINTAMIISPKLKIRNSVRKYILRKVALEIGLPKNIAMRGKKAIQYGSRSIYYLRKLAKKNGVRLSDFLQKIYSRLFSD